MGAPYAESWCHPANVWPSAFFTRQAMLQQRRFGPIRSSKMSRTCGSSASSSTQGQSRCDFVFIFLMSAAKRASIDSKRARRSRARSALIARTGVRKPSSWNECICASVNTFGIGSRLRFDEDRGVLRRLVAHVRREVRTERPWLWELQPQTQHVTLLVRLGSVDELCARVEHRVVVDELDVAGLEVHVEPQVRAPRLLVEVAERGLLECRERDVTLYRASVDLVPDVAAADDTVLLPEHRNRPVGHTALRKRGLAPDVIEAVVQQAEILRVVREDLVVHGHGAHEAADAAMERAPEAQQPDEITRVGVIRQVRVRLVSAHVDVPVRATLVVDVAEQIALGVLVERRAEIAAETPEHEPDVVVTVARHRQPAHDDEPAPAVHLVEHALETRAQHGERELLTGDRRARQAARPSGCD